MQGAKRIDAFGYRDCVELRNADTRVVLEPNCGGRVLSYSLNGIEVIHRDESENGWILTSKKPPATRFSPTGGRMDVGPEMITPAHETLWLGDWYAKITGPRSARLVSQEDDATRFQLIREFELDDESAHLRVTQHIINVGDTVKQVCHWGRTFVKGGGICLVPVNPASRYPDGYLLYGPGDVMDYRPSADPHIRIREGLLEIVGPPGRQKFAVDAVEGWIAYLTQENRLFIKTFDIYPERAYGEMAANTISIWYNGNEMCEIEPIGPLEILEPGESAEFTEDWRMYEYMYPEDKTLDYDNLMHLIDAARVTSILED